MSMELDVIADVNALLDLGVGDPYRLEHIKQAYIKNKNLWDTDRKYLEFMKEKYLSHPKPQPPSKDDIVDKEEDVTGDHVYCWNCGKKSSTKGNFCVICGSPLYDIGKEPEKPEPVKGGKTRKNPVGKKIPIVVGIAVVIIAILGAAYSQGMLDNFSKSNILEDKEETEVKKAEEPKAAKEPTSDAMHSKCGDGTVFDPETNSCVLDILPKQKSSETHSKCGDGTVFDPETNSCVLE